MSQPTNPETPKGPGGPGDVASVLRSICEQLIRLDRADDVPRVLATLTEYLSRRYSSLPPELAPFLSRKGPDSEHLSRQPNPLPLKEPDRAVGVRGVVAVLLIMGLGLTSGVAFNEASNRGRQLRQAREALEASQVQAGSELRLEKERGDAAVRNVRSKYDSELAAAREKAAGDLAAVRQKADEEVRAAEEKAKRDIGSQLQKTQDVERQRDDTRRQLARVEFRVALAQKEAIVLQAPGRTLTPSDRAAIERVARQVELSLAGGEAQRVGVRRPPSRAIAGYVLREEVLRRTDPEGIRPTRPALDPRVRTVLLYHSRTAWEQPPGSRVGLEFRDRLARLCEHDPALLARVREWGTAAGREDPTDGLMHESLETVISRRTDGVTIPIAEEMAEGRRLALEKALDGLLAGRTLHDAIAAGRLEDRDTYLNPFLLKGGGEACAREFARFPSDDQVTEEIRDRPPGVDGFGLHLPTAGRQEAPAFGGITFGNRVDGAALPGQLRTVTFSPEEGNPSQGTLLFRFGGGEELSFRVRAEEFIAAHRLLTGEYPGGRRWVLGEGIPLAGLVGDGLYRDYGPSSVRLLHKYRVQLHPALADTDVGYSTVIAQALPTAGRDSILRGTSRNLDPAVARRLRQDLDGWLPVLAPAHGPPPVYVLTDVPVKLTPRDGRIAISCDAAADPRKQGLPEKLLDAAFIELHVMRLPKGKEDKRAYDAEFAQEFYRLVPLLTTSSQDLHRVNQFAQVLAVVRWAVHQPGATFNNVPSRPQGAGRTPGFLAIVPAAGGRWSSEEGVVPIPGLQGKAELADRLSRIRVRIAAIERESPRIAELILAIPAGRLADFDKEAKSIFRDADEERLVDAAVAPLLSNLEPYHGAVLRYWFQLRCHERRTASRLVAIE